MFLGIIIFLRIALAISIIVKAYLYVYIANKNNYELGSGGGFPLESLWYLTKPVAMEYEKLKRICNNLQTANMILLLFLVVVSVRCI
jgi:hypothetical protein